MFRDLNRISLWNRAVATWPAPPSRPAGPLGPVGPADQPDVAATATADPPAPVALTGPLGRPWTVGRADQSH